MNQETNQLAQIIADAVDAELGTRAFTDGRPKRQDKAAAEAIAAEYVFVRRDELPTVRRSSNDSNTYLVDGGNVVFTSAENARMWVMRDVAVWQFIEAREAERDSISSKRRAEVAAGLLPEANCANNLPKWYELSVLQRRSIDRIIELEDAKA